MTAQKSKKNDVLRSGYSLIEVLLVVAILSSIAAGAVFGVRNVVQATENTKLQRDVSVLNSAIRTYLLSGGGFGQSDLQNPQAILSKLKRRAGDQNAKELAGLRGTMMDARLSFELQTAAEAVDGVPRARFISDPASPRFIIQTSGPPGIKRFVLDNSLAETDFGTESRNTTLKLAKNDPWVWDYTDAGAGRSTPSAPPRVNPAMSNQSPADITNLMLKTPAFSFSPGTYPLASFPMPLGLTNPNPAGSSQVLFSSNSAPWTAYSGAVNILPTESVTAYAQTLNPELFTDSDSISGAYLAQKVTLRTGDTLPATVNYSALGGPLAAGSVIPGAMLPPRLLLLNGDELPDYWENHSVFQMYWTQDGADPRSSVSRRSGNNTFEVTYPGEEAPLSLGDFASPSLTFKYFAGSKNENAVLSSTVTQKVITRAKLPLLPPQITPDQRSLYGNPLVAMSADLTGGQTPAGSASFIAPTAQTPAM